ncbi:MULTISPECIES: tyrosine-protein phosphatase [Rhodococcus erythropolis group]|uniref:Protein-tyrosine-phosphatase n=1 Tax=Rhodococcus qingshengii TaxID=334542 RepID=A0A2A5JB97_RHOSG|nr:MULTISPECIES: tyrosine-protein phosphatase [Rhodococcus erythropolis group]PCK26825.1 protein-tyrosine-phosphatase [Rhodococcus qingshengii]
MLSDTALPDTALPDTALPDIPLPDTPRLASIHNFRDVAGPGYVTTSGQAMSRGVFYRANVLTPSPEDLAIVESLGLTAVYDVRSETEANETPDTVPAPAMYAHIPILSGNIHAEAMALRTADAATAFMQNINRSFVADPVTRSGFSQLFVALATTAGPQLFHCTAGKDRTGWAAALLQTLAGVPRETIMADYLLTNTYSAEYIDATVATIAAATDADKGEVIRLLLSVEASYLGAAFEQVEHHYGTVENYLTTGLDLAPELVGALETKLVR